MISSYNFLGDKSMSYNIGRNMLEKQSKVVESFMYGRSVVIKQTRSSKEQQTICPASSYGPLSLLQGISMLRPTLSSRPRYDKHTNLCSQLVLIMPQSVFIPSSLASFPFVTLHFQGCSVWSVFLNRRCHFDLPELSAPKSMCRAYIFS